MDVFVLYSATMHSVWFRIVTLTQLSSTFFLFISLEIYKNSYKIISTPAALFISDLELQLQHIYHLDIINSICRKKSQQKWNYSIFKTILCFTSMLTLVSTISYTLKYVCTFFIRFSSETMTNRDKQIFMCCTATHSLIVNFVTYKSSLCSVH